MATTDGVLDVVARLSTASVVGRTNNPVMQANDHERQAGTQQHN